MISVRRGDAVLFLHVLQLAGDDRALMRAGDCRGCPPGRRSPPPARPVSCDAFEDILLVDVAQLDLRHVLRLDLVDAEADHQVGHHLGVLLRLPDDLDGLVDVQQDALEALEEVELVLLFLAGEVGAAADAVHPPGSPLIQNLPHAHDPGHPGDEDVEVAGEGVLQGGGLEQLRAMSLSGSAPALEVDGELQAVEVGLVPHVGDLLDLAGLDQLRHLVQNGLHGGGVWDLVNFDEVFRLDIAPLGPELHGARGRSR